MPSSVIRTHGLCKSYGRKEAIRDITLDVPAGSVFAFLGRNGAGKTTTMKILLGLIRATCGTAHVLGLECGREQIEILQRTAYVSEGKRIYENMTATQLASFNR